MNFKELLQITEQKRSTADSFRTTGEAMEKDKIKSNTRFSDRQKDAERKRKERARQIPRERKSKEELIREVIAVKTQSGRIQLIFKDSFDSKRHTKLNNNESMSMEEARSLTKDPEFEQTGASKLLFGNIKEKPKGEKGQTKKEEEGGKPRGKAPEKEEEGQRRAQPKQGKAKKLSKDEIFQLMSQMGPEQLLQMPFEMRQEYFKKVRNPPTNSDFDAMSFETLSTKFGINPISTSSYNQQVLNALIFLAKIKAGAGEQELESYTAIAPNALDFSKNAFEQAKKILSQIGEQCIQNLISSIENGSKTVFAEGNVDMECGQYKFNISAGGEFSLTTDKFNQAGKSYRGLLSNAFNQAFANADLKNDPNVAKFMQGISKSAPKYSTMLLSREALGKIESNPKLLEQMKSVQLTDSNGAQIGPLFDEKGNLNKLASLENYQQDISKSAPALFKGTKGKQSEFVDIFAQSILRTFYRGEGIKDPKAAPTHLVTQNGIFQLTDAYISEIAKTATVSVKPATTLASHENIDNRTDAPSARLRKFATVVEETQKEEKLDINSLFVAKDQIDPLQLALNNIVNNMDFDINISLLPGFTPKDLNTIQYNYVRINGKTVKVPVERTDILKNDIQEMLTVISNELLIESMTNNFVLSSLVSARLITQDEAYAITNPGLLNEDNSILKTIYNNMLQRAELLPEMVMAVLNKYNLALYEAKKRNYAKEYRNYHGKPKQRKERAARTKAREQMIKKGRVKKGDGKDIDHKRALRHGGSNGINNLRVRDKSENRADNGHSKGEKQDKDWK